MNKKQELVGLLNHHNDVSKKRLLAGFDGFVDSIIHVVDQRLDADHYSRIQTIADYGKRIMDGAGLSTNFEFVLQQKKAGGNGTIFAAALGKLGFSTVYIGATGTISPNEVFRELVGSGDVYGICEPASTEALEFLDGKLICSDLSSFVSFSWNTLCRKIGIEKLAQLMDEADVIGFNNWTMLTAMSDCWHHILEDVIPLLKTSPAQKELFFDLADPQKRSKQDILQALQLIQQFQNTGFCVTLGLNLKEATLLLGLFTDVPSNMALEDLVTSLSKYIHVHCIVVHPVDCAIAVSEGVCVCMDGPFCSNPKVTTGAGDNFNAGFMFGKTLGMPLDLCLLCGVSASGYYVRTGEHVDRQKMCEFLDLWQHDCVDCKLGSKER